MTRTAWVLLAAAAAAGLLLAVATASPGDRDAATIPTGPPGSTGGQPSGGAGGPCTPPGATVIPTGDALPQAAGTSFHHASCGWYPRTTCTNRVRFTLTVNGKTYDLGSLAPEEYAVAAGLAPPFVKPVTDSPVIGALTIPEGVNLGSTPVQATMAGNQVLDFGFPVLGCVDIAKKPGRQIKLTVTPAASDSSVITGVQPAAGTVLKQGAQLQLRWVLSRVGEVQIRVFFELTPARELSVRPEAAPADTVLDEQRPAGANQFTMPLADSAGHSFPAGRYRFEIRLIDSAGSTLVPAKPKSATFDLELAP